MKKIVSKPNKRTLYNTIMREMGKSVKKILESCENGVCDNDEVEECEDVIECDKKPVKECGGKKSVKECGSKKAVKECGVKKSVKECGSKKAVKESLTLEQRTRLFTRVINEMAGPAGLNADQKKQWHAVYDRVSKHGFDEEYGKRCKPAGRWANNDEALLHSYVAALIAYNKPCPQTEEEIDEIGVFSAYAHKAIDEGSVTLEDIQALYNKTPKIRARKARPDGMAPVPPAQKKPAAPAIIDDDDDDEEEVTIETADVDEPEDDEDVNYVAYDDVDTDEEDEKTVEDDEEDDDIDLGSDDDEDDVIDMGDDDDEQNDEDVKFTFRTMNDITCEDYDNPEYNSSWNYYNSEEFRLTPDGDIEISAYLNNVDNDTRKDITITGKSLGSALRKYDILNSAILNYGMGNMGNTILLRCPKVVNIFWKDLFTKLPEDDFTEADDIADELYSGQLYGVKNMDQLYDEVMKWLDEHIDE